MLVQAATGFVAPTKNAWLSLRLRSSDGGTVEDDAVEGAVSELRAYTPEDGERATQEQLDAAEAEKHAEAQPKEEAAGTEADARAAAESFGRLQKPVRDEPKTPRLETKEARPSVGERRRELQAEGQRALEKEAAEKAEREGAWPCAAPVASVVPPSVAKPKTPRLETKEARPSVGERRRALQAEGQRALEREEAVKAERDASWPCAAPVASVAPPRRPRATPLSPRSP